MISHGFLNEQICDLPVEYYITYCWYGFYYLSGKVLVEACGPSFCSGSSLSVGEDSGWPSPSFPAPRRAVTPLLWRSVTSLSRRSVTALFSRSVIPPPELVEGWLWSVSVDSSWMKLSRKALDSYSAWTARHLDPCGNCSPEIRCLR